MASFTTQIYGNVPGVRIMSEPWSLLDTHALYKQHRFSQAQYAQFLGAVVRVLMKPDPAGTVQHVVVKLTPNCTPQCDLFREMIPQANFFFLTRNVKPTVIVSP